MKEIGTPTKKGVKSALMDYATGAGGGLVYSILANVLGNGLIGGAAGAAIAGSVIKGTKGEILATMLGFQAIVGGFGGGGDSDTTGVM